MSDKELLFTPEEISTIDKNLGFLVFDWAKHLIFHIFSQARQKGIKHVYMNTPSTIDSGATSEDKLDYLYERLPPLLGFKLESVNLRGKTEKMWAFHLDQINASSFDKFIKIANDMIPINKIPPKYQGAFVGILGKKDAYTRDEFNKVLNILQKKSPKKNMPKFFYDWSKEHSGGQRFSNKVNEIAVLQKVPSELQNFIMENPTLLKFWSYMLSRSKHFSDSDIMGFALISWVKTDTWVINEVQTDCLNAYQQIRRSYRFDDKTKSKEMSWETLKDMLETNNRSKWVAKLEANEELKQQILSNPGIMNNLPEDSEDIDKWLAERQQGNLLRQLASVNFNTGVFRKY